MRLLFYLIKNQKGVVLFVEKCYNRTHANVLCATITKRKGNFMKRVSKNLAIMLLVIIAVLSLTAICAGAFEIDAPFKLAEGELPVDDGDVEHNFFIRLWNMILDVLRDVKRVVLNLVDKVENWIK